MAKKYLRQDTHRYSKFTNRAKNLKWRRPKGKHSKMRRFRKSYPSRPNIGERTPIGMAGKIKNMTPMLVHNTTELSQLPKNSIVIIARVGAKNKMEIMKKAAEMNLIVSNGGKNESRK